MTDDLSSTPEGQLGVWAFGRVESEADVARAEAAQRELARRAQLASERAEAALAEASEMTGCEHPESSPVSPAQSHRRRMLLTGIAGLAAAALGLGAAVTALTALTQPDPDPLAIFETEVTQQDRDWETRLTQDYITAITLGPRSFELAPGLTVIAFRAAAVVDGRSTEYDPYCLFTAEAASGTPSAFGGSCILPERFASDGLVLPIAPSASGIGFDTVIWGPTGAPRIETERDLDSVASVQSVLDWMSFPVLADFAVDPLESIGDPERVLLGPSSLPVFSPDGEQQAVITAIFLREGDSAASGPVFCAQASFSAADTTTSCAPLVAVRRDGLRFSVIDNGREWEVLIDADGATRRDSVRLLD